MIASIFLAFMCKNNFINWIYLLIMGNYKVFLDNTVSTLVPATIFMLLVFNVGPLKYRNEVKSAAILYLIIGLVYNFVKDWKSMKLKSKNNRLS